MKSTWTKNEDSTGVLKVEIETEAWKKAQEKALDALIKNVEVQGFRKGHAPKDLARKQVSQEKLYSDAINNVANDAYVFGLVEHKIEPVAQPNLDVEAMSDDEVTLVFHITVKPEVTLGNYKGLVVESEEHLVSDDDVHAELKKLQEENAELRLKESAAEEGDTVVIDFEGFKDGVAFEGGKSENYSLELGSHSFIPGFEEALVGVKAGEEKDVNVTFPQEYQAEDLAGQPVVFKVKVHEVKETVIPELDEEFVELLEDETISTLDELKESIKVNLEQNHQAREDERITEALLGEAVENSSIDLPHVMIHEELDQMFQEFQQRLAQQGLNLELYTQILGQSEEDIRSQMHDDAEKRVRTRLVLEKIAEVEELQVEEEEVEKEFVDLAEMYGLEVERIKELISSEQIKYDALLRKAMELVKENRA